MRELPELFHLGGGAVRKHLHPAPATVPSEQPASAAIHPPAPTASKENSASYDVHPLSEARLNLRAGQPPDIPYWKPADHPVSLESAIQRISPIFFHRESDLTQVPPHPRVFLSEMPGKHRQFLQFERISSVSHYCEKRSREGLESTTTPRPTHHLCPPRGTSRASSDRIHKYVKTFLVTASAEVRPTVPTGPMRTPSDLGSGSKVYPRITCPWMTGNFLPW